MPGWDTMPATVSKAFGEQWCSERRSAILMVPSVVARLDNNVLINPAHPDFAAIEADLHRPVYWDRRLFGVYIARALPQSATVDRDYAFAGSAA